MFFVWVLGRTINPASHYSQLSQLLNKNGKPHFCTDQRLTTRNAVFHATEPVKQAYGCYLTCVLAPSTNGTKTAAVVTLRGYTNN